MKTEKILIFRLRQIAHRPERTDVPYFVRGFRLWIATILCFLAMPLSAQTIEDDDQSAQSERQESVESNNAPDAPSRVDVKPIARDTEIEERLNEILSATRRFDTPNADVENGVVFLSGIAKEEEFKTWATELASNTQDVAAVVNRMTISETLIWDFSDAFAELRSFRNNSIQAIPILVFALIILAITWFVARAVGAVANRILARRMPNNLLRWVTTRAATLPVLIFGVYLVLRIAGLTQLALTVLGGTGLIGLIVGIAFQDIAENFLASILISVQKPFRIGDLIHVAGHDGIVQRVTTRGTTLLTPNGNHVQIPNSNIYKTTIENYTANPLRRISFQIGIGYDDSTSDAQSIVLDKIKAHSATINDPPPRVLLENLGAATVNLIALFWVDGTKNEWRSVRSSCMRIAKQALMQAGISLPDEAREVIFPNGVPVDMQPGTEETPDGSNGQTPNPQITRRDEKAIEYQPTIDKQQLEIDKSEAEGNMASDLHDLQKQGDQSWLPGEGDEILIGKEDNSNQ